MRKGKKDTENFPLKEKKCKDIWKNYICCWDIFIKEEMNDNSTAYFAWKAANPDVTDKGQKIDLAVDYLKIIFQVHEDRDLLKGEILALLVALKKFLDN